MNRFLVIGQGSMGRRRVRCLLANQINADNIWVYDQDRDRVARSTEEYGVQPASDLASTLSNPDLAAVIVSVPGALHVGYCAQAANAGKHWFSEIPLSTSAEGVPDLMQRSRDRGLVGAVGCQVLFHPHFATARDWAHDPGTGAILAISYSLGTYLPEWHPYEDYRKFYASDLAKGGGNLDVMAQEITWISTLLGSDIDAITCRMSKVGSLELASGTPDHQEMIVEYRSGLMASLHFDLNDRTHERWMRITAENGTLKWDTSDNVLRIYAAATKEWAQHPLPDGFVYETCYEQEIATFLRCIRDRSPWPVSLDFAANVATLASAMRLSNDEKRTVRLSEVAA